MTNTDLTLATYVPDDITKSFTNIMFANTDLKEIASDVKAKLNEIISINTIIGIKRDRRFERKVRRAVKHEVKKATGKPSRKNENAKRMCMQMMKRAACKIYEPKPKYYSHQETINDKLVFLAAYKMYRKMTRKHWLI